MPLIKSREGIALVYYGDDFTGSVDVMEALNLAGLRTALFLAPPTAEELARYPHLDAVGVAGIARTMSPDEMDESLLPVLKAISQLRVPIFHYKVCSTFDSSREIGSIGKAAELIEEVFGPAWIPLIVGAPTLKRYCVFGNLFADRAGSIYRLDRHPTMSVHPMTPMNESDLLEHVGRQTDAPLELVDFLTLLHSESAVDRLLDDLGSEMKLVLFDNFDERTEAAIGRQIMRLVDARWRENEQTSPIIGSSGLEYALARYWGSSAPRPQTASISRSFQTLVVAGSRARATELQVEHAINQGFAAVLVDPGAIAGAEGSAHAIERLADETVAALKTGRNVVLHTPPKAPSHTVDGTSLAKALGTVVARIADGFLLRRMIVAGGDTSGMITKALGITSLEVVASFDPGAPLCRSKGDTVVSDGLEICLKSGQIGAEDYFVRIADAGREQERTRERASK